MLEKFLRIHKIIEDLIESNPSKNEELEEQISKLKQESTRASLVTRADTSSKIINELESRLFEGEREKVIVLIIFG